MAKADKLLARWRIKLPKDARAEEVYLLLAYFEFTRMDEGGSSHEQYYHPALETRKDLYPVLPQITIVTVGGKRVKTIYVKNLLRAIEVVEDWISQQSEPNEG